MVRRVTPSQLQSMRRQAESRQRQAIQQVKTAIRQEEARQRQALQQAQRALQQEELKRQQVLKQALQKEEARQRQVAQKMQHAIRQRDQNFKRAIDQINRNARAYSQQLAQNQARIRNALERLRQVPILPAYSALHSSAQALNRAYVRLKAVSPPEEDIPDFTALVGYAEHENANSLDVARALLGDAAENSFELGLEETTITSELNDISPDLDVRWRGALYALNPSNPDAARHFCISAREIVTAILHLKAPDDAVFASLPECERAQSGRPTRRARIYYCLQSKGKAASVIEEFVDQDIRSVIDLFDVLNAGAHGEAGRYGFNELVPIKQRVEDAILFLAKVVN